MTETWTVPVSSHTSDKPNPKPMKFMQHKKTWEAQVQKTCHSIWQTSQLPWSLLSILICSWHRYPVHPQVCYLKIKAKHNHNWEPYELGRSSAKELNSLANCSLRRRGGPTSSSFGPIKKSSKSKGGTLLHSSSPINCSTRISGEASPSTRSSVPAPQSVVPLAQLASLWPKKYAHRTDQSSISSILQSTRWKYANKILRQNFCKLR